MKKFFLCLWSCIFLTSTAASAQMPYMEEVKALGIISGQGLACGSSKYKTYEMLARAILITKAPNAKLMDKAIYVYNEEKANAYMSKQLDGNYECPLIVRRFDNQDIFNITLYEDGTLEMPDGKIIKPRRPYDANQIYNPQNNEEIKAKAIYGRPGNTIPVEEPLMEAPAETNPTETDLQNTPEDQSTDSSFAQNWEDTADTYSAPQPQPRTSGVKHISRRR